jgi:hypothetical protein
MKCQFEDNYIFCYVIKEMVNTQSVDHSLNRRELKPLFFKLEILFQGHDEIVMRVAGKLFYRWITNGLFGFFLQRKKKQDLGPLWDPLSTLSYDNSHD